jgi:hypothetical protein
VDDTIRALANVRFVEDPVAGVRYSRATSIVSSAYKRHGRILEIETQVRVNAGFYEYTPQGRLKNAPAAHVEFVLP